MKWRYTILTLCLPHIFIQAFLRVLDQCPKIEEEIPLVKSYLAQFAARAIIADLVSIADLAHQLENGAHFPLFLLCLQQLVKLKDREWLTDLFQQSKVNMQKMLPGRSKDTFHTGFKPSVIWLSFLFRRKNWCKLCGLLFCSLPHY